MDNRDYNQILDTLPPKELFEGKTADQKADSLPIHAAAAIYRNPDELEELTFMMVVKSQLGDSFSIKVLDLLLSLYARKSIELPPVLKLYDIEKSEGKIEPKKGRTKLTNLYRDIIIRSAGKALTDEGVSENSAAEIVSLGLANRGYAGIGQEAVRHIMKAGKSLES